MQRKIVYGIFFLWASCHLYGQECSRMSSPRNNDIDVPVESEIRWTPLNGIIGYVVSLGTTPGGEDIVNRRSSGLNNYFIPELGLPPDTVIYITISYFKEGQPYTTCAIESFRTEAITTPPECTFLTEPLGNTSNIAAESNIKWAYAPSATGYLLSIGSASGQGDIIDRYDVGNVLSYDPPNGLPADGPVYITIIPYNDIGMASSCLEENFDTTSVVMDCGPVFDPVSGQYITPSPTINIPDQVSICNNQSSLIMESDDQADGYRWYKVLPDGTESLLSNTNSVQLTEIGSYRYEAYNTIVLATTSYECSNTKIFSVVASELAIIKSVDEFLGDGGRKIIVNTEGIGVYEYSLDHPQGPYQSIGTFNNVSNDFHTIYIRDKNGCGMTSVQIQQELSGDDFPKFFTPNGDNYNDFWQYIPPQNAHEIKVEVIHIYDRYGILIAQLDPKSRGWDGNFNGSPLPASDYWFRALASNKKVVRGHFALMR